MHLDLDHAVALAGFAAAALHVEGEAARLVAAGLRLRQPGKPVADGAKGARVGRRVRARRPSDGGLVDDDDLVDLLQPLDVIVIARRIAGAVQVTGEGLVQRFQRQGRFAGARDPRHTGHDPHREVDRHVVEVVGAGALNADGLAGLAGAALGGHFDLALAGEVLAGDGGFGLLHLRWRAFGHHGAAVDAGARAHVDQIVGRADGIFVVFDHQHGITQIAQPRQGFKQAVVVALVQPDRRLIQHVEHACQA